VCCRSINVFLIPEILRHWKKYSCFFCGILVVCVCKNRCGQERGNCVWTCLAVFNVWMCVDCGHIQQKKLRQVDDTVIFISPWVYHFDISSVCNLEYIIYCRMRSGVQSLRDLRSSYVPEDPVQVEFCARQNWVCIHIVSCVCRSPGEVLTQTHWSLIDRRYDRPAACVIAQQYSFAIFSSLHCHSRKEKSSALFKNFFIQVFLYFKMS
jgi:hypothetical protein